MSDIKLKAASGGGSISIKGPSSLDTDRDLVDTSGNINLLDSQKLNVGTGNDLKIRHDGTNNHIEGLNGSTYIGAVEYVNIRSTDSNGSNAKWMVRCHNDAEVSLYHNNTLQCETSANGLAFPSGKGIDFSATGNGTGGTNVSELLDDYEEGNFTPTSGGWSALGTASYNTQWGRYVKIGSQVTVHCYVSWSSISGASGVHAIGGFPFAHSSSNYSGACWTHPENMGDARVSGLFGNGYGSGILLYVPNSGAQGYVSVDTNGGIIRFTCIYHTDA